MKVAAHRLAVDTPAGWEARIFRRPAGGEGDQPHPIVHAATFPLPAARGDFGSGAVDRMRPDDVLVALVEYDAESAATPLFAASGLPRPRAADFHPRKLQRTLPGQSGSQWFFHVGSRAFCLYVVLGSHSRRARLMPHLHALLDRLRIG